MMRSFPRRWVKLTLAMTVVLSFHQPSLLVEASTNDSTKSHVVSATKDVVSGTKRVGRIRYHYFDDCVGDNLENTKQCSDILLMGVGAAMSVDNYDNLAKHIVTQTGSSSLVVVITDSNPGNIVKFSATKYADLSNYIRLHRGLIPICNHFTNPKDDVNLWIGGHSASGQAALDAAQKALFEFVPSGFVGLDPYDMSIMDVHSLPFPTLDWGFTHTTCLVQVDKAARGAYQLSSPEIGRVLYAIDNQDNDMTHCVFTDSGCQVGGFDICPLHRNYEWVYEGVATSINKFVYSSHPFDKETFELPTTRSGQVSLFVNNDHIDREENSDSGDSLPRATRILLTLILMIMVMVQLIKFFQHPWLQRYNFILNS